MDINQIIKFVLENKPVLTVFIIFLWWLERNNRLSAEKRERALLRQFADCPPEPEPESPAAKVGVITTSIALAGLSAVFLVGCGSNMTYEPPKTQPEPSWQATEAFSTPTQIATPGIIEVTAAPEWVWDVIGVYTPTLVDMNVRSCSVADDNLCPVVGEVKRDEPTQFFAIVRIAASGDVWLCLDSEPAEGKLLSQCGHMVAWYLDGVEYGKVSVETPAG